MASLIPTVIKKTITGNYGMYHKNCPNLFGKVVIVTGGTNGIGLSLSRTLFTHGANLFVISHSEETGKQGVAFIKSGKLSDAPEDYAKSFVGIDGSQKEDFSGRVEEGVTLKEGTVEFVKCNFENLKEVNKVAKDLKEKLQRLDIFYGIAGKGVNAFSLTEEGVDSHLALNNLSHHILLSYLFPIMVKTSKLPDADVRIVQMSSELHRPTIGGPGTFGGKFKDLKEFSEDIGPASLYFRSKLCVLLFTKAIVQRHLTPSTSILALATHPGAAASNQLNEQYKEAYGETVGKVIATLGRPVFRKLDQGSLSTLWSGTSSAVREGIEDGTYRNGEYFTDPEEIGGESGESNDQELINNFYNQSERLIESIVGEIGDWKH